MRLKMVTKRQERRKADAVEALHVSSKCGIPVGDFGCNLERTAVR